VTDFFFNCIYRPHVLYSIPKSCSSWHISDSSTLSTANINARQGLFKARICQPLSYDVDVGLKGATKLEDYPNSRDLWLGLQ
jgi:hypothetical protein